MSTTQPIERSSFQLKVDAALKACTADYSGLRNLILTAGKLAAVEGLQPCSPLIDLADAKAKWYFDTSLRWLYQRVFWSHSDQIRPEAYFDVQVNGPWVEIKSLGIAGGKGQVTLHESQVTEFFHCAGTGSISNYERWALNPHPVGGTTMLMRMCDIYDYYEDRSWPVPADEDGVLFIDPDTHPSDGRIYFGDPNQELQQIGALCQLEKSIVALLAAAAPSQAEKQAAAERATRIAMLAGVSFMPSNGYCSFCDSDVTHALADIAPGDSITGCPVCGHTWCD